MNVLFDEFKVHNHKELLDYMKNNPEDIRVQQLKAILEMAFMTKQQRR